MKLFSLMLLIFSVTFLLMSTTSGITAEDPDLVAHYPFEGNPEDASGNGNHGTITGGSEWVKGKIGDALHLDPAAYIEIPVSDSLHGDIFKTDPFTISAWIQPNFEGGAWEHIWRSLPGGNAGHNTLFLNKDSGLLSWRGQTGAWTILCQTEHGIVKANEWLHVIVRNDGTQFRIYANGEKAAETDFQETLGGNTTYRLGGSDGETFAGIIDDVAVFSRALSENEIKNILDGVTTFLPVDPQAKLTTIWANLKNPNPR